MPMTANELNTMGNLMTLMTRWKDASFSIAASNGNLNLNCSGPRSCFFIIRMSFPAKG